jgi:dynein heavy chain
MNELRNNLKIKGVALKRINPKGMSLDEFIGSFDGLSHEWIEGIFTTEFRRFSLMNNDKKKWILLDGPIDYNWVENFNSILDDNRKISLPNGE